MITIRPYIETDAPALAGIYYHTIHTINTRDYSPEQIQAWAPATSLETQNWLEKWCKLPPLVAVLNDKIVGFAELETNGHIDCFYCHHEHQGAGIGTALMREVEIQAKKNKAPKLFAEVSITAKPFFEAKGFKVVKEQTVKIRGVVLTNFLMEKVL